MARPLQPRPLASLPTAKLSTGCPQLDAVLGGGLPVGSLTEVAGEAAASKTQLSLQLLLSAQLPQQFGGLDGAAVYVYTEGEPAMRRLHQLARWLHLRYPPEALAALPDPTANIFVEKGIDTGADLLHRLQRLRGLLDQQRLAAAAAARTTGSGSTAGHGSGPAAAPGGCTRPVRLLVVDSIAHVLRDMGDSVGASELAGRTELLFKISALLRRYADEYGLAVLLVNQIVDSVTDSRRSALALPAHPRPAAKNTGHTGGLRLVSLGREVVPALGLAWANCVNTRLFLSRCAAGGSSEPARYQGAPSAAAQAAAAAGDAAAGGAAPALRKLQVVFSPHLPRRECYYVVEATGVRGLAPEELEQHEAAAAQAAWEGERQRQQAWQQQQQQQQQAMGPPPPLPPPQQNGGQWGQQQARQPPQQAIGQQRQLGQQHQQPPQGGQWGQQQQYQQQQQQQGSQWGQQQQYQQHGGQWGQEHRQQQQQQPWGQQQQHQHQQAQQHGGQWGQRQQQHGGQWGQNPAPPEQQRQQGWGPKPHQWQQGQAGSCPSSGRGGSVANQQPGVQPQIRHPLHPQQPQAGW